MADEETLTQLSENTMKHKIRFQQLYSTPHGVILCWDRQAINVPVFEWPLNLNSLTVTQRWRDTCYPPSMVAHALPPGPQTHPSPPPTQHPALQVAGPLAHEALAINQHPLELQLLKGTVEDRYAAQHAERAEEEAAAAEAAATAAGDDQKVE
jgi:hypothetical protein